MKSFQILLVFGLFNISISAKTTISEVSGVYEMGIEAIKYSSSIP